MAKRRIKIKNFRNIGVNTDDVFLLLNNSCEIGEIGDLVYLIGPNNSGKSNILDCVCYFGKDDKKILSKDKPDFIDDDTIPETEVSLIYEDVKGIFTFTLSTSKTLLSHRLDSKFEQEYFNEYFKQVDLVASSITSVLEDYKKKFEINSDSRLTDINKMLLIGFSKTDSLTNAISNEKQICSIIDSLCKLFVVQKVSINETTVFLQSLNEDIRKTLISIIKNPQYLTFEKSDYTSKLFNDIYGYKLCPNVYIYKELPISKNDLSTTIENIDSSPLLLSLFKKLNLKKETITKKYAKYKESNNSAILRNLEKKYSEQMNEISDTFNNIYGSSEVKYSFGLNFYPNCVCFSMNYGDSDISIEKQSTGFKWFFDFFFNFMFKNNLEPGDILIMDEPALCLHVSGQEELRETLKDFAIRNAITILIATHSPFLVSPDYFDEIRVVDRISDKDTTIKNNFENANCLNNKDTIYPIVKAFTTFSSVIINPSYKKYLVEGITDYNYLIAFKKMLGIANLVFIPFNGVGKKAKDMEETCIRLKNNCINCDVLVDGDNAGSEFANIANKNGLNVKKLSDIKPEWKTIESLFDESDKTLVDLSAKYKKQGSEESAKFKNLVIFKQIKVSDKTKENFKALFKALL